MAVSTGLTLRGSSRNNAGLWRGAPSDVCRATLALACDAMAGNTCLQVRVVDAGNVPNPNPAKRGSNMAIHPMVTTANVSTGPWAAKPVLVSDADSRVAIFVNGQTGPAIFKIAFGSARDVSISVETMPQACWERFEDYYNMGNSYAQLKWDSDGGVFQAQSSATASNLG